ncbi:MAG: aminopeptidase [Kiritimatiellae bacterium]|nr:aminopeptidase [Kiritimatiellia bacterium]
MSGFNLPKLLRDVFAPAAGETVLVMVDLPREGVPDNEDWAERRAMAEEWRRAFASIGAAPLPLLSFPASSGNNADLPEFGMLEEKSVRIADVIARATIAVAMTKHSATAPLSAFVKEQPNLRVASMPGVLRRMEKTALAADYREVARKAQLLAARLERAELAVATFDTGHQLQFDLRFRHAHADDGVCTREKEGFRLINLPSGEAFIVPYEGERAGIPSRTQGEIPVSWQGEQAVLLVRENRIVDVTGDASAERLKAHFDVDPARRNIAELGLGCNDSAAVLGSVLEDEKAGFHWAYGRSEHLGGVTGPDAFSDPKHVVHHDIVYARGCPIGIKQLDLLYPDGTRETIMHNSAYTL